MSWATGVFSILFPLQAQAQITPALGGPNTQVSQDGNVFDISGGTQSGGNLFHKFEAFSVGDGQTANFLGDSNVFNIVGQVSGLSPSYINGLLQVSGSDANLYLINPAGILFGPNGQLSLSGSFAATTADQVRFGDDWLNVLASESDYAAFAKDPSAFAFTADSAGAVVNQGNLTVAAGESLVLMGGSVVSEGRLAAAGGEVGLVAVGSGDRTIRLGIPGSLLSLEVEPDFAGTGSAFSPTALPMLLTGNPSMGASQITVLPDGGVQLNGRSVSAEEVAVTGEVTTRSQTTDGGTIALLGRSVNVLSATVDASGAAGGTVRIGRGRRAETNLPFADLTLLDANSMIRANGLTGAGGSIVVGSKAEANLQGALSAKGATQGGFVETSADYLTLAGLSVEANGSTGGGQWLLDPVDIEIVDTITKANQMTSTSIEGLLDSNVDVTITTTSGTGGSGDLSLLNSIAQTGSSAASLTLTGRRFSTNGSKINLASTGELTFNLNAVNQELMPSGDSVAAAIASIGSVAGDRTINLTDGVYTFSDTVALNTDVDIIGASRDNTVLNIDANARLFAVNSGGEVGLNNLTFGVTTAGQGGGIANKGTLTLDNILATGNTSIPGANGGAIDSFSGSRLTVSDSEFRDNGTAISGGAIAASGTIANLSNSLFKLNNAQNGGAISLLNNSLLTVDNSLFENNTASVGGAIRSIASAITLTDSTVKDNIADVGGGLSLRLNSVANIVSSRLENNTATFGGGANLDSSSTARINNSQLTDNRAQEGGGVRIQNSSTLESVGTRFEGNVATAGNGGGLHVLQSSAAQIDNASFARNMAAGDGGAVALGSQATANITATAFDNNEADYFGGALYTIGTAAIANSTFLNNRARVGGGIVVAETGELTAVDTQISNNQAAADGGGVALLGDSRATLSGSLSTDVDGRATTATTRIENNQSVGDGGGIVVNDNAVLNLSGGLVQGNVSGEDGGGLAVVYGTAATVVNSNFENNVSAANGGGLYRNNFDGNGPAGESLRVSNSRFIDNRATNGGGLFHGITAGDSVVEDSVFRGNQATNNGGGLYANSAITVEGTAVVGNQAAIEGGGLYVDATTAEIKTSLFADNASAQHGGGIAARDAQVAVRDSRIKDNRAMVDGGGVRTSSGSATLENTNISNNVGGFGGGLELSFDSQVLVRGSELSENVASGNGGGIQVDDTSHLMLEGSTLANNRTAGYGGGLFNLSRSELVNTTLYGNEAEGEGGAIATTGSSAITAVRNSTISQNRSASAGGGIASDSLMGTRLLNTIVAENGGAIANDVSGRFVDEGNNLIGESDGSTGFTTSTLVGRVGSSINPSLAPLADNGGATRTQRLNRDSVAIDAGINNNLPAADQRGLGRVVGAAVDIGAVELTVAERSVPMTPELSGGAAVPDFLDPTLLAEGGGWIAIANNDDENADNRTISQLERGFGRSFEDYWNLPLGPVRDFDDVQNILRRAQEEYKVNSAIIYAVFLPEQMGLDQGENKIYIEPTPAPDDLLYLALVMPEGELVRYQLPVTREQATSQVRLLRNAVSDPEDEFGYLPLTQQLYRWLLAPLEEDLERQGIQNLMYALDTGLRNAPVTAMRDHSGFSLERYGISVVPNMGLTQAEFGPAVKRPTVAMGVSQFATAAPLPAVPIELTMVKDLVTASSTLLNEGTTIDALESVQALEKPGVLHLATHANFDQRSPETSSILMWDQPLSMKEFAELDWLESDLELLILSACSTALSSANAELGFAGLAAAAGVDATVGSLWEVSDVGTLALMSEFYAQLEQTDLRFEALRQAQLSLLRGETRIQNGDLLTSRGVVDLPDEWNLPDSATLAHPFFWSAFTMVGNPW